MRSTEIETMARQVNVKMKDFVKAVKAAGFVPAKGGGKGSHAKWVKAGSVPIVCPTHAKEVPFYVVKQAKAAGVVI